MAGPAARRLLYMYIYMHILRRDQQPPLGY